RVRCGPAVGEAPSGEVDQPLPRQALTELIEEARFPNAGFAHHPHDLPAARLRLGEQGVQGRQLALPPHERAQLTSPAFPPRGASVRTPENSMDHHRRELPWE